MPLKESRDRPKVQHNRKKAPIEHEVYSIWVVEIEAISAVGDWITEAQLPNQLETLSVPPSFAKRSQYTVVTGLRINDGKITNRMLRNITDFTIERKAGMEA